MTTEHLPLLNQRAPKLLAKLGRSLGPAEHEKFIELFGELLQKERFSPDIVVREDGVSFNLRPARVTEILIDSGTQELNSLSLALLCSVKPDELSSLTHTEARSAATLSEQFSRGEIPSMSAEQAAVVAALALDEVRHLHLDSRSADEKNRRFRYIKEQLLPVLDPEERIVLLLSAAVNRYFRYRGEIDS